MDDVLRLRAHAKQDLDEDAVHDLRVALRRCRTLARGAEELAGGGPWRALAKLAKKPFRRLGALRDLHVLAGWVDSTAPRGGKLRARVERRLEADETKHAKKARRALRRFDTEAWRELAKRLAGERPLRGHDRGAARRLALRRWVEAVDAHGRAWREPRPESWHAARIGWKRLRYTLEAYSPELHAAWKPDLVAFQDLLGELHDLDVLAALVRDEARAKDGAELVRWLRAIEVEREARMARYAKKACADDAPWRAWGDALARL